MSPAEEWAKAHARNVAQEQRYVQYGPQLVEAVQEIAHCETFVCSRCVSVFRGVVSRPGGPTIDLSAIVKAVGGSTT